ncbi:hypothetical protein GSH19_04825 [Lactobacillus sp. S2-2]|uniref:hypothetical protein n=1 Tax=Lactobacillus sp. S2-2 TaxID=2692917 RepID=UPI001F32996D|nr:hypothetical protein [Lactobacillus sp. S2-2]MCF6515475.1 hypothetical protein [Lactobacillus sp. S2-2]
MADVVSYFRDVYSEHDINFALNDLRESSFIYGGVRIIEESNNKYSMNISTIRLF